MKPLTGRQWAAMAILMPLALLGLAVHLAGAAVVALLALAIPGDRQARMYRFAHLPTFTDLEGLLREVIEPLRSAGGLPDPGGDADELPVAGGTV